MLERIHDRIVRQFADVLRDNRVDEFLQKSCLILTALSVLARIPVTVTVSILLCLFASC